MSKVLGFLVILVSAVFMMLEFNLFNTVNKLYDAIEFRVFMEDNANVDSLGNVIISYPEIIKISFVSKEEALEEFYKSFRYSKYFIGDTTENPLPASFKVTLANQYKNSRCTEKLSEKISTLPGVMKVNYSKEWLQNLGTINGYFKWLSIGCASLLLCFLVFILVIGVNHQRVACKEDIKLLKEFGIPKWKLRLKFGWQAIVWNIVFAGVSIGLVYYGYSFIIVKHSIGMSFINTFLPLLFMVEFIVGVGILTLILLFINKL